MRCGRPLSMAQRSGREIVFSSRAVHPILKNWLTYVSRFDIMNFPSASLRQVCESPVAIIVRGRSYRDTYYKNRRQNMQVTLILTLHAIFKRDGNDARGS